MSTITIKRSDQMRILFSGQRIAGLERGPRVVARLRDPETSHEAAEQFEASGSRESHEARIVSAMAEIGKPATYQEIAERCGLDGVQVMRRLSGQGSLSDRGLVERSGYRKCSIKGRHMTGWKLP